MITSIKNTFGSFTELQQTCIYNDFALTVFSGVCMALYLPLFVDLFGGDGMVLNNSLAGIIGLIALVPGLLARIQKSSRKSFISFLWLDIFIVSFLLLALAGVEEHTFILMFIGCNMLLTPLKMPLLKMIDHKVRDGSEDFMRFESQTDVIFAVLAGSIAISSTLFNPPYWITIPVLALSMIASRILRYKMVKLVWPKGEETIDTLTK